LLILSIYIQVRTLRKLLAAIGISLLAVSAQAAHTHAQLVLADESARAGETVMAGVHLKMDPDWHTYWKNPGEAGMATKIEWHLPPGVTAGEVQWPLPEKLPPADVTTYGYRNEVVLLVPLKLAADLKPGVLDLKAKVSWLECKEQCVPADGEVQATLNVGSETKPSPDAALINFWQGKTPKSDKSFSFQVHWEKKVDSDMRTIIVEGKQVSADALPIETVEFFPDASDQYEIQGTTEKLPMASGFALRKTVKEFSEWPARISGVIVIEGKGQRTGFELNEPITGEVGTSGTSGPTQPLGRMLLYAFIGGLILNIMPCVLPVIALKILGFVGEARNDPRHVRKLGVVYTLGVLVSFVIFAVIVIALRAAGKKVGWGFQFGDPRFLVTVTILVMLIALNLFGVFEVNLSGKAMGAAAQLGSRRGFAGAFFSGFLATALATPCMAPILGTALGFAFLQKSSTVVALIFLMVGLGLAAPYLMLSLRPTWLKFVPKPGPWMERFKIALGFPILAAGVWLFTLVPGVLDKERTLWFGLFLVALAAAAWIWGQFVQRGARLRGLAMAISVLLVGTVGAYAYFQSPPQIEWQPWSNAAVIKAQSEGHPVLVDFTADWCLTCQVNKKVAIEVPSVRAKLKQIGAVSLVGDYTRLPDAITEELNRYDRAGVPLVLVFSAKTNAAPIVLPEVLTPGIVVDALDRAAK
jgi:thiol:disulfide interchange protein